MDASEQLSGSPQPRSSTIIIAAAVAVIAMLLGWRGGPGDEQPPWSTSAGTVPNTGTKLSGGHEPILTRIDCDKLLRRVGPYMPLY